MFSDLWQNFVSIHHSVSLQDFKELAHARYSNVLRLAAENVLHEKVEFVLLVLVTLSYIGLLIFDCELETIRTTTYVF